MITDDQPGGLSKEYSAYANNFIRTLTVNRVAPILHALFPSIIEANIIPDPNAAKKSEYEEAFPVTSRVSCVVSGGLLWDILSETTTERKLNLDALKAYNFPYVHIVLPTFLSPFINDKLHINHEKSKGSIITYTLDADDFDLTEKFLDKTTTGLDVEVMLVNKNDYASKEILEVVRRCRECPFLSNIMFDNRIGHNIGSQPFLTALTNALYTKHFDNSVLEDRDSDISAFKKFIEDNGISIY